VLDLSPEIDYNQWLTELEESNPKYQDLFLGERSMPPIFFFGDPEEAKVATVGVNPSAKEFSLRRRWYGYIEINRLIERCKNYFKNPLGVPPHPWFTPWKNFLNEIGFSYTQHPRAVHLDLSPRATRSMSSIQKKSKQLEALFRDLIKNDLGYFISQLKAYPEIKHLYAAGSITRKYYLIEFLQEYDSLYGYSLRPIQNFERGGQGKIGLYMLDLGDNNLRYLFFCSTSPSARRGSSILPEKAPWLKKHYPEFIPQK